MKFHKRLLIIFFVLFALTEREGLFSQERSHYIRAAKNISFLYGSIWLTSFAHELGHALTAYCFYGNPIKITMGANASNLDHNQPLLKLPFLTIRGFSPFKGFAKGAIPEKYSWKNIIIAAAGPVAGMVSTLVALKIVNSYDHKNRIDHFINEFVLINILTAHFGNLLPLFPFKTENSSSDGYTCEELDEMKGIKTDGDYIINTITRINNFSSEQRKRLKNFSSISIITLACILFCKKTFDAGVKAFK